MDDTKTMLRAIINGQSSLKQDLLKEIGTLKENLTEFREENKSEHEKMTERINNLGQQLAYLEDDAPTKKEFDELEERVGDLEVQITPA